MSSRERAGAWHTVAWVGSTSRVANAGASEDGVSIAREEIMRRFVRNVAFASLSVKDLLEARDQYHVHLANLDNVIGTAIGRYRIRNTDPNAYDPDADAESRSDLEPRTLANSSVKKWSWP